MDVSGHGDDELSIGSSSPPCYPPTLDSTYTDSGISSHHTCDDDDEEEEEDDMIEEGDDPFFASLSFCHQEYQLLRPMDPGSGSSTTTTTTTGAAAALAPLPCASTSDPLQPKPPTRHIPNLGHRSDFLLEYQVNPFVPEVYYRSAYFLMLNEMGQLHQINQLDRSRFLCHM